jgi:thiamine-phosphate pyrophosphorylase
MDPARFSKLRLIGITDREVMGMGSIESAAASALEGGLPALMLREKDLPDDELLPLASRLRDLTGDAGALLLVNRRLRVARAVGADGVHLGADGPSIEEARRELGPDALIGYSAHSHDEAMNAFKAGADYVIFSPIYETPSKAGVLEPIGLAPLRRLAQAQTGPVIALGGISADNIGEVARTGAAGVAAIRAIFAARNPAEAVRSLLQKFDKSPIDSA